MKKIILSILVVIMLITTNKSNALASTNDPVAFKVSNKHKVHNAYDFYYKSLPDFTYFIDGPNPDYYAILLCNTTGWYVDSSTPSEEIDVTFHIFRTGDPTNYSTLTRSLNSFFDIKQGISGVSTGNNNGTFDVPAAGEWISNNGTYSIEVVSAIGQTSLTSYNIIAY